MLFPSFYFYGSGFRLGQNINTSKLQLSTRQSSSKISKYYLYRRSSQNKSIPQFNFFAEKVCYNTLARDLSHLFNVPVHITAYLLANRRLQWLTQYIEKNQQILVYLYRTEKSDQALFKDIDEPIIKQIEYGYHCVAIVSPYCETDFESLKEEVIQSITNLFEGKRMKTILAKVTLVHPNYCNTHDFVNLEEGLKLFMHKTTWFCASRIGLNFEYDLKENDECILLLNKISECEEIAKKLKMLPGVQKTKIVEFNLSDIIKLEKEILSKFSYPNKEYSKALQYYEIVCENVMDRNKKFIMEVAIALKSLLDNALQSHQKFIFKRDRWFLKASVNLLSAAPHGTQFFITCGDGPIWLDEVCNKNGFIFIYPKEYLPKNSLYFVGDEVPLKGCGIIFDETINKCKNKYPSVSLRLYTYLCSCGNTKRKNVCICDKCKSLFYYHQKLANCISCKCGSFDLKTLKVKSLQAECEKHDYLKVISANVSEKPKNANGTNHNIYNMLIMGPSGTGKSTLINAIANYLRHDSLQSAQKANDITCVIPCQFEVQDDDYESHIVSVGDINDKNENFNDKGQSSTQEPQDYYFSLSETEVIHIIDTPGLADSRGIQQDDKNLEMIRKAVTKVGRLHALCFVLKPNESKLNVGLETTMKSLLSIFPHTAFRCIVFCFTCSRGTNYGIGDSIRPIKKLIADYEKEFNATIPYGKENIFCMDNEGFLYLCAKYRNIVYTTTSAEEYEHSWVNSRNAAMKLINHIRNIKPYESQFLSFHTDIADVVKTWAKWIQALDKKDVGIDRLKRFSKISYFLHQNKIGQNTEYFIKLAEAKGPRMSQLNTLSFSDIKDLLYQEFIDSTTNSTVANAIEGFLISYIDSN